MDSEKVVRGLAFNQGKKWIPLLLLNKIYNGNVWIIGSQDHEMYVVDLRGAQQPTPFQKLPIKCQKFKIPVLNEPRLTKDNSQFHDDDVINRLFCINHNTWRYNNYRVYKDNRVVHNPDYYYSENLVEDDKILKDRKEFDKMILTLMNQAIVAKEYGTVESLFSLLTVPKSKMLSFAMCQELNQMKLVESLNRKHTIEKEKQSQKSVNFVNGFGASHLQKDAATKVLAGSDPTPETNGESFFNSLSINVVCV